MSTKDVIKKSILEGFSMEMSTFHVVSILLITVLLSVYIFYIYRLNSHSSFYSRDFNKTLAIMPVLTAAIVLALQASLVISLGMVGALSIVRFRNAIKKSHGPAFPVLVDQYGHHLRRRAIYAGNRHLPGGHNTVVFAGFHKNTPGFSFIGPEQFR